MGYSWLKAARLLSSGAFQDRVLGLQGLLIDPVLGARYDGSNRPSWFVYSVLHDFQVPNMDSAGILEGSLGLLAKTSKV